jgi:D-threonate/D-erythronate kinase
MPEVAVIADDLTGAADCGIAFAAAGLPTFVALGEAPAAVRAQVLAIDTDTRRLAREEAVARATAATERALRGGARVLYRKLDSTLRGHVGPELAATLRAAAAGERGRPLLVVAPAFPATGRVTRDGRVFVKGVPLEETEVWRDAHMQGTGDVVAMLRLAGVHASVVRLVEVRSARDAFAREVVQRAAGDVDALVCDAEEERDLRAVADAAARLDRPVVWAGSAGLAHHLPAALALKPDPGMRAVAAVRGGGPVLVLVGSRSSVARQQAAAVAAEAGVARVDLDARALLAGDAEPGALLARALAGGDDVVAVVGEQQVGYERATDLAVAAGRLAAEHAARLGGLVATGGDIARAAFAAIGATGLHLLGEVEPGVPLGVADARPPLPVVTKAGAFGSAATLSRCRAALRDVGRFSRTQRGR